MLKLLLHITIILALLIQQMQMAVVCVVFKMEQSYLSKNVCENRSNLNSNCKAHCQLAKRIQEQDRQEQQNKILLKEETEFIIRLGRVIVNPLLQNSGKKEWLTADDKKLLAGITALLIQPPEQLA